MPRLFALALILVFGLILEARGHTPSLAHLSLKANEHGQIANAAWDISLADLDLSADLDTDRNGRLTWGEIRPRLRVLSEWALGELAIFTANAPCVSTDVRPTLIKRDDDTFLRTSFAIACPDDTAERVFRYTLFGNLLPNHRVLVTHGETLATWTNDGSPNAVRASSALTAPGAFITSGIHHILIGWDHLAFIVAVLVGAMLVRLRGTHLADQASSSDSLHENSTSIIATGKRIAWLLSVFTIAHSLTLALAVFDLVTLPDKPVEAAIAASIVFAGGMNLWPQRRIRPEALIFAFGLVHGLGFANVMQETGATTLAKALALINFNLGVEIGQFIFAAALFVPLLFVSRRPRAASATLVIASFTLMALGTGWFIERTTEFTLL